MKKVVHVVATVVTMAFASAAFAADSFDGTWKLTSSAGEAVITVDGDKATSDVKGAESGSVAEQDGSAVITWDSGMVSVISSEGDGYVAKTYAKGVPLDGEPAMTFSAAKE